MPCRDDRNDSSSSTVYVDNPETKKRLDKVTRMLCSVMKKMEQHGLANLVLIQIPGLHTWWGEHQEMDRKREAKEKAEKERKTIKRNALAKLTDKEKKILGL